MVPPLQNLGPIQSSHSFDWVCSWLNLLVNLGVESNCGVQCRPVLHCAMGLRRVSPPNSNPTATRDPKTTCTMQISAMCTKKKFLLSPHPNKLEFVRNNGSSHLIALQLTCSCFVHCYDQLQINEWFGGNWTAMIQTRPNHLILWLKFDCRLSFGRSAQMERSW